MCHILYAAVIFLLVTMCDTKVNFYKSSGFRNFADCSDMFLQGAPPTGFVENHHLIRTGAEYEKKSFGVEICQKYKETFHYATLYNKNFRIPIYSAYKMRDLPKPRAAMNKKPTQTWKYESGLLASSPYLVTTFQWLDPNSTDVGEVELRRRKEEMLYWGNTRSENHEVIHGISTIMWLIGDYDNRQGDRYDIVRFMPTDLDGMSDYGFVVDVGLDTNVNTGNIFDKGHLYPGFYAGFQYHDGIQSKFSRESTFAITNSAPFNPCLNSKIWKKAEMKLLDFMSSACPTATFDNYFLTGTGFNELKLEHHDSMTGPHQWIPPRNSDWSRIVYPERVAVPDFFWTAACCKQKTDETLGFGVAYYSTGNYDMATVAAVTVGGVETVLNSRMQIYPTTPIKLFHFHDENNPCYASSPESQNFIEELNTIAQANDLSSAAKLHTRQTQWNKRVFRDDVSEYDILPALKQAKKNGNDLKMQLVIVETPMNEQAQPKYSWFNRLSDFIKRAEKILSFVKILIDVTEGLLPYFKYLPKSSYGDINDNDSFALIVQDAVVTNTKFKMTLRGHDISLTCPYDTHEFFVDIGDPLFFDEGNCAADYELVHLLDSNLKTIYNGDQVRLNYVGGGCDKWKCHSLQMRYQCYYEPTVTTKFNWFVFVSHTDTLYFDHTDPLDLDEHTKTVKEVFTVHTAWANGTDKGPFDVLSFNDVVYFKHNDEPIRYYVGGWHKYTYLTINPHYEIAYFKLQPVLGIPFISTIDIDRGSPKVNLPHCQGLDERCLFGRITIEEVASLDDSSAYGRQQKGSALLAATYHGDIHCMEQLIRAGADIEARDEWPYYTSLRYAASAQNFKALELLLHSGADVNAKGNLGWTAITSAAVRDKLEVVLRLILHGANVSALTHGNNNLLHDIIWQLYNYPSEVPPRTFKYLLETYKDQLMEGVNTQGYTPYLYACYTGNQVIIDYLRGMGADVHAVGLRNPYKNTEGKSCAMLYEFVAT